MKQPAPTPTVNDKRSFGIEDNVNDGSQEYDSQVKFIRKSNFSRNFFLAPSCVHTKHRTHSLP